MVNDLGSFRTAESDFRVILVYILQVIWPKSDLNVTFALVWRYACQDLKIFAGMATIYWTSKDNRNLVVK